MTTSDPSQAITHADANKALGRLWTAGDGAKRVVRAYIEQQAAGFVPKQQLVEANDVREVLAQECLKLTAERATREQSGRMLAEYLNDQSSGDTSSYGDAMRDVARFLVNAPYPYNQASSPTPPAAEGGRVLCKRCLHPAAAHTDGCPPTESYWMAKLREEQGEAEGAKATQLPAQCNSCGGSGQSPAMGPCLSCGGSGAATVVNMFAAEGAQLDFHNLAVSWASHIAAIDTRSVFVAEYLERELRHVMAKSSPGDDNAEGAKAAEGSYPNFREDVLLSMGVDWTWYRPEVLLDEVDEDPDDDEDFPPFGVDPGDSAALERLRMAIDDHLAWPTEATQEAGDYEAAVRHSGEQLRHCPDCVGMIAKLRARDDDMIKLLVETVEEAGGKITFDPKRTNRVGPVAFEPKFRVGQRVRKRYTTERTQQFARVTGVRTDGCIEFVDDAGCSGFDETADLELAEPAFAVGQRVRVKRGGLTGLVTCVHRATFSVQWDDDGSIGLCRGDELEPTDLAPSPEAPDTILRDGLPRWLDDMRDAMSGGDLSEAPQQVAIARLLKFSNAALSFMNTLHLHLGESASPEVPGLREELIAALMSVHDRTRNAAGETRMTGVLFRFVADELAKKSGG